jgi:hypothetical protein
VKHRTARLAPFFFITLLLTACGAGLVVRQSAEWDQTDWYGKKVYVLPGLAAAGIGFSDPNPNDNVSTQLHTQLVKLPRYKKEQIVWYEECCRIFSDKGHWPRYRELQQIYQQTGRVDLLQLHELGTALGAEYLLVPLFLSTGYTSWEFSGIFSYYSAAVELAIYSIAEKEIVFRARARGYSLGDLEKAWLGAAEEVVKVFK